jgi:hypothetical protein
MTRRFRFLTNLPLALCLSSACIAPWNAIVKYSDTPAPTDANVAVDLYRVLLEAGGDSVVVETSLAAMKVTVGRDTLGPVRIPGYWTDSLKREIRAALGNARFDDPAEEVPAFGMATGPGNRRLWLSRAGFNHDSTIAVVREVSVWPWAALDEVVFLARRPGYRWVEFRRVARGGWIS